MSEEGFVQAQRAGVEIMLLILQRIVNNALIELFLVEIEWEMQNNVMYNKMRVRETVNLHPLSQLIIHKSRNSQQHRANRLC